jgi:hypothetical protein
MFKSALGVHTTTVTRPLFDRDGDKGEECQVRNVPRNSVSFFVSQSGTLRPRLSETESGVQCPIPHRGLAAKMRKKDP